MSGMFAEVGDSRCNGVAMDWIPAGLPWPHTVPKGKDAAHSPGAMRSASIIRPTSPKSTGTSANVFDSVEVSDDEENVTDNMKLDATYLHANGNAGLDSNQLAYHLNANGETLLKAASRMIHSHNGVQPDPIAVDILGKEPDHERPVINLRLSLCPRCMKRSAAKLEM